MACEQTGEHSFRTTKGPSSDMVITDLHVRRLKFLTVNMSHTHHTHFGAKYLDSTGAPEVLNEKGHCKPVDLWSIGWG